MKQTLQTLAFFLFFTISAYSQMQVYADFSLDISKNERDDNKSQREIIAGINYNLNERLSFGLGVSTLNNIRTQGSTLASQLNIQSNDFGERIDYRFEDAGVLDSKSVFASINIVSRKGYFISFENHLAVAQLNSTIIGVITSNHTKDNIFVYEVPKSNKSKLFYRIGAKVGYQYPLAEKLDVSIFGKFVYSFLPTRFEVEEVEAYDFEFKDEPGLISTEMESRAFTDKKYFMLGLGLAYSF